MYYIYGVSVPSLLIESTDSIFSDNPPPVANSTTECPKQEYSSTATRRIHGKKLKGVAKHEALNQGWF